MEELFKRLQISIRTGLSIARDHDVAISPDVSRREFGASTYLRKIADTLGCSIEELILDGRSLKHTGQVELLRLWSLLPDDAARIQVLETARTLASVDGLGAPGLDENETISRPPGD